MVQGRFREAKPVIGTVELLPLPGSQDWQGDLGLVLTRAEQEAVAFSGGGVDAVMVENSFDRTADRTGKGHRLDTASAIAMASACQKMSLYTDLPLGISVRPHDPEAALAIALNTNAQFIRLPVLIGALLTEDGFLEGHLHQWTGYLQHLQMQEPPAMVVDVTTNHWVPGHSPLITRHQGIGSLDHLKSIIESLHTLQHPHWVDALCLHSLDVLPGDVDQLKKMSDLPLWVDGPMDLDSVGEYYGAADGLILTGWMKKPPIPGLEGRTAVDPLKVETIMSRLKVHRTHINYRDALKDLPASVFRDKTKM